jgi:hypothetical protein
MLNIGLDLHKRETQICIVDASGAIQLERGGCRPPAPASGSRSSRWRDAWRAFWTRSGATAPAMARARAGW